MSVLVVLEQSGGNFHRMGWEAIVAAKELDLPVYAATIGAAGAAAAKALDKVYSIQHPDLSAYSADGYTAALEQLIRSINPEYVVFPHTYQVRDYAPKLATRFGCVLVSDAVKLSRTVAVRQLFQGKLNADFTLPASGPRFISVQAGAYRGDALGAGSPEVVAFTPELASGAIRVKAEAPFRESSRAVDLTAAEIIVSVGRGIKEKENIVLIEELATAFPLPMMNCLASSVRTSARPFSPRRSRTFESSISTICFRFSSVSERNTTTSSSRPRNSGLNSRSSSCWSRSFMRS